MRIGRTSANCCWSKPLGLAVLAAIAVPASLDAAGIGFVNELKGPIVVQGSSIENGMVRRGPPILIFPGKVGWDMNLKPGPRSITIYDGRQTTRILYQGPPIPFAGQDMLFAVRGAGNPLRIFLAPLPVR